MFLKVSHFVISKNYFTPLNANTIMKVLEIHYNFVRLREILRGKTSFDKNIPYFEFKTPNKRMELIEMGSKN